MKGLISAIISIVSIVLLTIWGFKKWQKAHEELKKLDKVIDGLKKESAEVVNNFSASVSEKYKVNPNPVEKLEESVNIELNKVAQARTTFMDNHSSRIKEVLDAEKLEAVVDGNIDKEVFESLGFTDPSSIVLCNNQFAQSNDFPMYAKLTPVTGVYSAEYRGKAFIVRPEDRTVTVFQSLSLKALKAYYKENGSFPEQDPEVIPDTYKHLGVFIKNIMVLGPTPAQLIHYEIGMNILFKMGNEGDISFNPSTDGWVVGLSHLDGPAPRDFVLVSNDEGSDVVYVCLRKEQLPDSSDLEPGVFLETTRTCSYKRVVENAVNRMSIDASTLF